MKNIDKFRGCLIGGAAGDALGYAVEFIHNRHIRIKYGENGITEYALNGDGKAIISDDTQMTLFTAEGLLLCNQDEEKRCTREGYKEYILQDYKWWLDTQEKTGKKRDYTKSWLMTIPELFVPRAPGLTCLAALRKDTVSTFEHPINNSKGCGGVMRVAPIGLFLDHKDHSMEEINMIGAEAALLTHGHELGYIPAATLTHIVHMAANCDNMPLWKIVEDALIMAAKLFEDTEYLEDFLDIMNKALYLAECKEDDLTAIQKIGEGWIAEEALAIAVFCAVKYENNFEKALIASVNHSGDSDSTGAIAGNILGAHLGLSAIPEKFLTNLELKDEIIKMADMLWEGKME